MMSSLRLLAFFAPLCFSFVVSAQGEVGETGGSAADQFEQGTVAPPGSGSGTTSEPSQLEQTQSPAGPAQIPPGQTPPAQPLPSVPQPSVAQPVGAPQASPQASPPQQIPVQQSGAFSNEPFNYDPAGRRDPFRPYRLVKPGAGGKDQVVMLEPLQTFDLEQLVILGILWDVHQPRALIQAPDGSLHTIVTRSKIGKNDGYVAAIREGEIVVIESFEEGEKIIKKTQVMEFKK